MARAYKHTSDCLSFSGGDCTCEYSAAVKRFETESQRAPMFRAAEGDSWSPTEKPGRLCPRAVGVCHILACLGTSCALDVDAGAWGKAFTAPEPEWAYKEPPKPSRADEFDEAVAKITQVRGEVYGHPADNFKRIVALQALLADCPTPEVRHALDMICVKLARLVRTPDHVESLIDIAGYARTVAMALDRLKPKG
jgi:hypothetical protein